MKALVIIVAPIICFLILYLFVSIPCLIIDFIKTKKYEKNMQKLVDEINKDPNSIAKLVYK